MAKVDDLLSGRSTHSWSINEHLGALKKYGEDCEHITEFGVHCGFSTTAFLAARPKKLVGYDLKRIEPDISLFYDIVKEEGITEYEFHEGNVLCADIEETDLLFVDDLHDYHQVKGELFLHGNKAKKYLIFHDTISRALTDETPSNNPIQGILRAIYEFLAANPHWFIHEHFNHQSGLTIFRRAGNNELFRRNP